MESTVNKNQAHELQIHVQLKSGRAVSLVEDVTEAVHDGMTQEMLYDELRKDGEMTSVTGQKQGGNIVMIPLDAIDFVEMNIRTFDKETI
ncbi:hypothetical protein [Bacillus thuringiensis]|uniref:hypothetical protein n=1 Tax=Bacillus thuringiensis TaxID=1428 RepID=UPI002DB73AC1|nr:hypothetical protein [Bacillus thuringiensis]MEC2646712.1 hypothetical protein [Bacillus thuringiensis]